MTRGVMMSDAALAASLPFWFVVGMWARLALEDVLAHRHVRHVHRKRARGAG